MNFNAQREVEKEYDYAYGQSMTARHHAFKNINYQTTLLVDAINRGEVDAPAMPSYSTFAARRAAYKRTGGSKIVVRAAAARAASSMLRQAGYASRRAAYVANSLARTGGRMPASSTELKNIDVVTSSLIPLAGTGVVTLLNGVAQGTTATTRLGRRIVMRSLLVKFEISMAATSTGASPIRILIVYDAQTNATAPVATDVLTLDQLNSPMNLSNSRRFKTLCDIEIPCIGTGGPQASLVTRYVKLNMNTEFNTGSAGTVGDIQSGSVYMLTYQDNVIATAAPVAIAYTRIRYSDN